MSHAHIHIQDTFGGVKFRGQLDFPAEQPTPAEQIARYLAAHQEQIAKQSALWFAAQLVAHKTGANI